MHLYFSLNYESLGGNVFQIWHPKHHQLKWHPWRAGKNLTWCAWFLCRCSSPPARCGRLTTCKSSGLKWKCFMTRGAREMSMEVWTYVYDNSNNICFFHGCGYIRIIHQNIISQFETKRNRSQFLHKGEAFLETKRSKPIGQRVLDDFRYPPQKKWTLICPWKEDCGVWRQGKLSFKGNFVWW